MTIGGFSLQSVNDNVVQCHKWSEPAPPPVASTADMFHKGCAPGRHVLRSLRNKLRLQAFFHAKFFLLCFVFPLCLQVERLVRLGH